MSQRDVYMQLNMSPNGYASYEQGRTEPNIATLKQLCAIFGVSADYLLGISCYDETSNPENGKI